MALKEEHESWVISSFLEYLGKSGLSPTLVEFPDQLPESSRTFETLTTDGLIRIDARENQNFLALDVMALALPSENLIYSILAEKTEKLLLENNLVLNFTSYVMIEMSELKEVYKFIENEIRANPTAGTSRLDNRLNISWKIEENVDEDDRFRLDAGMLRIGSGALWEQIKDENQAPLSKKAGPDGQASRAQREGLPYILLLDCIGNGQIRQGTHFLSQFPQTYEQGVLAALGENISRVGAIYLLTKSESWEMLYLSEELVGVLEPPTS